MCPRRTSSTPWPSPRARRVPPVSSINVGVGEEPAVAVSALVLRKATSQIRDDLEAVGATDILLFALSNARM